ncbi:hypothetical protein ES703_01219 [subsurface metagenome]
MSQEELYREIKAIAEQSYNQLDGKWLQWLEVARRFDHKAIPQDRLDLRHTIIVAFADQQARNERLGKPDLSLYGMLRIASHCVADYWRELNKATIRVCVLNGLPRIPDHKCSFAGKPSKCSQCPFLAVRPIESLNTELEDTEGNRIELIDTLADDKAIDLDQWLDTKTFRLGCPDRLIQLAVKRHKGIPLNQTDQRYFTRQRQKELKRYQKTLF